MKYIYETHCHTDESSNCGKVPALETAALYKAEGYAGIMITDHFNSWTFKKNGLTDWDDCVDFSMRGYRLAKTLEDENFKVFYGQEIRFEKENDNDYLVFGMSEEYLRAHPFIQDMESLEDFYKLVHPDGIVVFQAHPFRKNMTVMKPEFLDGIEVYNGNPRQESRCEMAHTWADKYNLRMSSGSDFHQLPDLARGGIIANRKAENENELRDIMLSEDYGIIFRK